MGYTIVDLLAKLMTIEENACNMYKNIAKLDNGGLQSFKTVARILAAEEERHVEFYKKLMKDAACFSDIELDIDLYDRASKLINEFRNRMVLPAELDVKSILEFAALFEKQNAALLIDIRGRLFKKPEDSQSTIYMALTDLILEEEKHIRNIEPFLQKSKSSS